MPDSFIFICPFCNQKLDCDSDLENKVVVCPSCNKEIVPNQGLIRHKNSIVSSGSAAMRGKNREKLYLCIGLVAGIVPGIFFGVFLSGVFDSKTVSMVESAKSLGVEVVEHKPSEPIQAARQKMFQLSIKSPDWSTPTQSMLLGMTNNDFLRNVLSPLVDMVEKRYPKSWDMPFINQAVRCTVKGEPAQIYFSGEISDSDAKLVIIIQRDDSDDQYDFALYVSTDGKVFTQFAIDSSVGVCNVHSLDERVIAGSSKTKSEKINISEYEVNGHRYYGSAEFFFTPSNDKPIRIEFYDKNNGWLKDIEMTGKEFSRFSMALLYAYKQLNDYHFKRFYWYKPSSSN